MERTTRLRDAKVAQGWRAAFIAGALATAHWAMGLPRDLPAVRADSSPTNRSAPAGPSAKELRERLSSLAKAAGSQGRGAVDQARRALARADRLSRQGEQAAADRARQIAWAACTLAARQIALAEERNALRAVQRSVRQARARTRSDRGDSQ